MESDGVSIDSVNEDVPVLLKEYLEKLETQGTAKDKSMATSISFQSILRRNDGGRLSTCPPLLIQFQ